MNKKRAQALIEKYIRDWENCQLNAERYYERFYRLMKRSKK